MKNENQRLHSENILVTQELSRLKKVPESEVEVVYMRVGDRKPTRRYLAPSLLIISSMTFAGLFRGLNDTISAAKRWCGPIICPFDQIVILTCVEKGVCS